MRLNDYPPGKLQVARDAVADFWGDNARKMRASLEYAPRTTEDVKDAMLLKALRFSNQIRAGQVDHNFTVYQRPVFELAGESPALLPE